MLVLASASPRRSELLTNAGIPFRVQPADVPEIHTPGETPEQYVQRLALSKAQKIAATNPNDFILGADTVVIVDHHILEKPGDAENTRRMLSLLSGRTHQVTTGVCLIDPRTGPDTRTETTDVTFTQLSDNEIDFYISTGEPLDRAGAYAIQGYASRWTRAISGCYFNVVGLPVPLVYRMLKDHAVI